MTTVTDPRTDAERARDAWNLRHPVGTPVTLRAASGRQWPTSTRSPAHVHADRAVVCVADWPGAHPLTEITPITSDILGGAA
jgi:hypothetical protein